jgi:hypothetical protein
MHQPTTSPADDTQRLFQHFIAQHDGPAYLRRARRMHDAIAAVHEQCRRQREEWLLMPRLHLGRLAALAGSWEKILPLLRDVTQAEALRKLHADLAPKLRLPPEVTHSPRRLRQGLRAVIESNQRFNERWQPFVERLDLSAANTQIDGYNRYYLLEKECVVSSPRIARMGFEPRQFLTTGEIFQAWPLLPVPVLL